VVPVLKDKLSSYEKVVHNAGTELYNALPS